MSDKPLTFQEIILTLDKYWAEQGCTVMQPYDSEVGAGTFHTATLLRSLGPAAWRTCYPQPCRRPADGRYGDNPNRLQHYYQFQVLLKPSPVDSQDLYLGSLAAIGLDPNDHDVRFVEDDWESPTLGAWGLGWEVWLNGMHIHPYVNGGVWNPDPDRRRKLLLHRRQIDYMEQKLRTKGVAIVPLQMYFDEHNRVKLTIALATGKKLYDKRADMARRDSDREIRRVLKERSRG